MGERDTGLAGGGGVVKPLDWHRSHMTPWNGDFHTVPTAYSVRCADENGWKWQGLGAHGYASSPEGAQAGAQAHHNDRIRSALAAPGPSAGEDWRNDPTANEQWNAGCDFAMTQLCKFLGVDPNSVTWDAATETVDGDVSSVIGNILREHFGEDWSPSTHPAPAPAGESDPPCTDCEGTGTTYQTERPCACQATQTENVDREAAYKAAWEHADDEVGWEATKGLAATGDAYMRGQVEWHREMVDKAIDAALVKAEPAPLPPAGEVR